MSETPTPEARTSEIVDALRGWARDLVHDAASWREASDQTGGFEASALLRDALENEKLATTYEDLADKLEAELASKDRDLAAFQQCSGEAIGDGNAQGADGVIHPGDPAHCIHCECGKQIAPKLLDKLKGNT